MSWPTWTSAPYKKKHLFLFMQASLSSKPNGSIICNVIIIPVPHSNWDTLQYCQWRLCKTAHTYTTNTCLQQKSIRGVYAIHDQKYVSNDWIHCHIRSSKSQEHKQLHSVFYVHIEVHIVTVFCMFDLNWYIVLSIQIVQKQPMFLQ